MYVELIKRNKLVKLIFSANNSNKGVKDKGVCMSSFNN